MTSRTTAENLLECALSTYLRSCEKNAPWPTSSDSSVELHGVKRYVVLRKGRIILAVYKAGTGRALMRVGHEHYPEGFK